MVFSRNSGIVAEYGVSGHALDPAYLMAQNPADRRDFVFYPKKSDLVIAHLLSHFDNP